MTWYNSTNYGTMLQCRATTLLLKNRYSVNVYLPNYYPHGELTSRTLLNKILSPKVWRRHANIFLSKIRALPVRNMIRSKDAMVKKFNSEYDFALDGKEIKGEKNFDELNSEFDLFITGSDQIWNPDFLNSRYLLDFVSDSKHCIAIASSICKGVIPAEKQLLYKRNLKKFELITIREYNVVDQLSNILDKNVYCILDPTLLLGSEVWKEKMHQTEESNYVLLYTLGESISIRKEALAFSKSKKKKLLYFPQIDGLYKNHDKMIEKESVAVWDADPYEWIGLIDAADYIITDSFHMTAFSIMLHKNFWVVPKEAKDSSQNARILNLLSIVGLSDRFLNRNSEFSFCDRETDIEWKDVDEKLARKRILDLKLFDGYFENYGKHKDEENNRIR